MANIHLDGIAVAIIIIMGFIFFGMSVSVFKNLDAECPSSALRDGWVTIQALGAFMITAGIYYFICVIRGDCYKNSNSVRTSEIYFVIFGIFFLIIIAICATMLKEYDEISVSDKQNCDDNSGTTKRLTTIVSVISGIGVLGCGGMIAKLFYDNEKL